MKKQITIMCASVLAACGLGSVMAGSKQAVETKADNVAAPTTVAYQQDFEMFDVGDDSGTIWSKDQLFWFNDWVATPTIVEKSGHKGLQYQYADLSSGALGGIGSGAISNLSRLVQGQKYRVSFYLELETSTTGGFVMEPQCANWTGVRIDKTTIERRNWQTTTNVQGHDNYYSFEFSPDKNPADLYIGVFAENLALGDKIFIDDFKIEAVDTIYGSNFRSGNNETTNKIGFDDGAAGAIEMIYGIEWGAKTVICQGTGTNRYLRHYTEYGSAGENWTRFYLNDYPDIALKDRKVRVTLDYENVSQNITKAAIVYDGDNTSKEVDPFYNTTITDPTNIFTYVNFGTDKIVVEFVSPVDFARGSWGTFMLFAFCFNGELDINVNSVQVEYLDGNASQAKAIADAINAIGTVEFTQTCKDKIDAARSAYNAAPEAVKALIINGDALLIAAETTYADFVAAENVDALIDAIGTVELTNPCDDKIKAARAAYNALSDFGKTQVTKLNVLEAAEATYADLDATTDAACVDHLIDEIGTVELTQDCKDKIDVARMYYDELNELAKSKVTKLNVLTAAEAAYASLKQASEECKAFYDALDAVDEFELPTQTALTQITAARAAYNALSELSKTVVDPDAVSCLEELENDFGRLLDGMVNDAIESLGELRSLMLEDEYMMRESILIDLAYIKGVELVKTSKTSEELAANLETAEKFFEGIPTASDVAGQVLAAQNAALNELLYFVDLEDYSAANAALVDEMISVGYYAIIEATTVEEVTMALVAAESQILTVPTLEETASYTLADDKDYYVGYIYYLTDGMEANFVVNEDMFYMVINSYVGQIYSATTTDEVEEIFLEFYKYLPGEFTDEYSDVAVLQDMIAEYTALLEEHENALIAVGYRSAEIDALDSIVSGAISNFSSILSTVEYYNRYYYGVAYIYMPDVIEVYEQAIESMDALKSHAQYLAEELVELKEQATAMLEEYAPVAQYNINRAAYEEIMEEALADIENALVASEVVQIFNDAKTALNEIRNDEMAEARVDSVDTLIAAIGEVDATEECGAKILAAREAYEELTETEKYLVEDLETLVAAEADYDACVEAAPAIEAINAIGEVEYKVTCKYRIVDARAAYDSLSEAAKAKVSAETLAVLTDAEEQYASLKEDASQVGCAGSIAAASGIITLVTLLGAGLLASKRKED